MNASPDVYVGPAFRAWRSWRIMPFERLGAEPTLRLCASGTHGLPKVWEPLQPMRAVCGKFNTTHEAPWFDCECGFHGYREQWQAEDHLATFVDGTNGDWALGWAFGEVSLWGRIVEHVDGYRAEYAYPYSLTVFGDAALAARVRGLYGVDVDVKPVGDLPRITDDSEDDEGDTHDGNGIAARLDRIKQTLDTMKAEHETMTALQPQPSTSPSPSRDDLAAVTEALRATCDELERPVTARELAERLSSGSSYRFGSPEYVGLLLYRAAIGPVASVVRLRDKRGRIHWRHIYSFKSRSSMHDLVETDPTLDHHDRDVAFISAALAAARATSDVFAARDLIAALSDRIGSPQRAQSWSGCFPRCVWRGWLTEEGPRRYSLTVRGEAVARLGALPPRWGRGEEFDSLFFDAIRAAIAEKGDAVTVHDLGWRFRGWRDYGVDGHQVGQRLMTFARRGWVEGHRRHGSLLMHWRLTEAAPKEAIRA